MIISIKEARRILGKDGENLSDQELLRLIEDLDSVSKESIKKFLSK